MERLGVGANVRRAMTAASGDSRKSEIPSIAWMCTFHTNALALAVHHVIDIL